MTESEATPGCCRGGGGGGGGGLTQIGPGASQQWGRGPPPPCLLKGPRAHFACRFWMTKLEVTPGHCRGGGGGGGLTQITRWR